jgi:hypothetical protein
LPGFQNEPIDPPDPCDVLQRRGRRVLRPRAVIDGRSRRCLGAALLTRHPEDGARILEPIPDALILHLTGLNERLGGHVLHLLQLPEHPDPCIAMPCIGRVSRLGVVPLLAEVRHGRIGDVLRHVLGRGVGTVPPMRRSLRESACRGFLGHRVDDAVLVRVHVDRGLRLREQARQVIVRLIELRPHPLPGEVAQKAIALLAVGIDGGLILEVLVDPSR